jgi:hypothetical protein
MISRQIQHVRQNVSLFNMLEDLSVQQHYNKNYLEHELRDYSVERTSLEVKWFA